MYIHVVAFSNTATIRSATQTPVRMVCHSYHSITMARMPPEYVSTLRVSNVGKSHQFQKFLGPSLGLPPSKLVQHALHDEKIHTRR